MYSNKMYELGSKSSVIRELFMYGREKADEVGEENVYDFSLGSPSVPAPNCITDAVIDLLKNDPKIHSYTPAAGDGQVRSSIAKSMEKRFAINTNPNHIYMTCGAAASLTCSIRAITNDGDEWIVFAPFFPEYKCFIETAGGKVLVSKPNLENFEIDFSNLEGLLSNKTKGVIINSPNNPSGSVYSEETIKKLAEILKVKSEENGQPIYIITDEPYREIVYDNLEIPYVPKYYANTIVCYSFSKSFSLAGERIGYIYVNDGMEDGDEIFAAVCGAGRSMGYVCASSLFQKVIGKCIDTVVDQSVYLENRNLLYEALTSYGYECVKPQGAFYLFVKTLDKDAEAFCEYAKLNYNLLVVPSNSFGVEGYMRISYCVDTDMIKRSLPSFKALVQSYK